MRTNKEHFTTLSVHRSTKAKLDKLAGALVRIDQEVKLIGKIVPRTINGKLPTWLVIDLALRTLERDLAGM